MNTGEFIRQEELYNTRGSAYGCFLHGEGLKIHLLYRKSTNNNFIYNIELDNYYYNSTTKIKKYDKYSEYLDCMFECGEMEELYYTIIQSDIEKLENQINSTQKLLDAFDNGDYSYPIDIKSIGLNRSSQEHAIGALSFLNRIEVKLKYPKEQIIYF